MAEIKKTRLTQAGFDKLVAELEDLKVNKRKEIADKIKEARAQGDLSENAEYDAAKDEQSEMEGRIEEIEQIMKNHEIVTNVGDGRIGIGCKVLVKDIEMDETMELILYLLPACAILGFVVFVLWKLLDGVFRLIAGFEAR